MDLVQQYQRQNEREALNGEIKPTRLPDAQAHHQRALLRLRVGFGVRDFVDEQNRRRPTPDRARGRQGVETELAGLGKIGAQHRQAESDADRRLARTAGRQPERRR